MLVELGRFRINVHASNIPPAKLLFHRVVYRMHLLAWVFSARWIEMLMCCLLCYLDILFFRRVLLWYPQLNNSHSFSCIQWTITTHTIGKKMSSMIHTTQDNWHNNKKNVDGPRPAPPGPKPPAWYRSKKTFLTLKELADASSLPDEARLRRPLLGRRVAAAFRWSSSTRARSSLLLPRVHLICVGAATTRSPASVLK
jgi:hypothetical protein